MTSEIELALVDGRVRTLDPDNPSAQAVAVAGGRIAAVGSDDEVRALCGPGTEVIELDGAAVVPGLIDSHMHPFKGAVGARGADLLDAHTLDDVLDGLRAERRKCQPGEWVLGWGLDYNVFEQTGVSSAVIDEAVGGAPAAVTFMDFHTVLASTHTISACSTNSRGPSIPASSSAFSEASIVWKSMNVSAVGAPPTASSITDELMPVPSNTL